MQLRSRLTLFFAVYIIALSFTPLVHNMLLGRNAWSGYGTGAYAIQSDHYFVLFNDPYDGSSKPNIHVNPDFAPNARISLIEFSDWTSWIDGFNLFNDFNITIRADQRVLDVTYTRPEIALRKFVEVSPDAVTVKYVSKKEFSAHLELWKWVITSINGISIKQAPKPIEIPTTTLIEFTFNEQRLQSAGKVRITLSRVPSQIMIWPYQDGFNKITLDFVNSEMSLSVLGSIAAVGRTFPTWNYADLPYVYPLISISVVAIYVLVDRYGRTLKNRSARSSN